MNTHRAASVLVALALMVGRAGAVCTEEYADQIVKSRHPEMLSEESKRVKLSALIKFKAIENRQYSDSQIDSVFELSWNFMKSSVGEKPEIGFYKSPRKFNIHLYEWIKSICDLEANFRDANRFNPEDKKE